MSKSAAETVFRKSGLTPEDVQVIELHDCFSANELITYEAIGLCPPGGWTAWVTEDVSECSAVEPGSDEYRLDHSMGHRGCVRVLRRGAWLAMSIG